VLDPFLAVPLFLALTANQSTRERAVLVRVVTITVFACARRGGAARRLDPHPDGREPLPRFASAVAWCCC
jgi:hypothetical protein